jgi:hypothetical protein
MRTAAYGNRAAHQLTKQNRKFALLHPAVFGRHENIVLDQSPGDLPDPPVAKINITPVAVATTVP